MKNIPIEDDSNEYTPHKEIKEKIAYTVYLLHSDSDARGDSYSWLTREGEILVDWDKRTIESSDSLSLKKKKKKI